MAKHPYLLIDAKLHNPLTQGYIVTKRGGEKAAVMNFARYMETDAAHKIMEHYGFVMPKFDMPESKTKET